MTTTTPQWARDAAHAVLDAQCAGEPTIDEYAQIIASHALGWVSVEDRLPEDGVPVIAYTVGLKTGIIIAKCDLQHVKIIRKDSQWWYRGQQVTHWMPLPEPPQEIE